MCFLEGLPRIYSSVHSVPRALLLPDFEEWSIGYRTYVLALLCRLAVGLTLIGLADALRCRRDTLTTWFLCVIAVMLALGAVFCAPLLPWWIANYQETVNNGGSPTWLLKSVFSCATTPLVRSLPCLLVICFIYPLRIEDRHGTRLLKPGITFLAAMWVSGCAVSMVLGSGQHCWEYHGIPWHYVANSLPKLLALVSNVALAMAVWVVVGLLFRRSMAFIGLSLIVAVGTMSLWSSLYHGPLDPSRPITLSARIQDAFEILAIRSADHFIPWLLIWLIVGQELIARRSPKPAAPADPRCGSCDYNLRGLPGWHRCPECGSHLIWPKVRTPSPADATSPTSHMRPLIRRRQGL